MANKKKTDIEYDSNPFTLSFKGFGLLADYARGVMIVLLVLSGFGFIANLFSGFGETEFEESTSSELSFESDISTTADSIEFSEVLGVALLIAGVLAFVLLIGLLITTIFKGFVAAGTIAASEKRQITIGQAFSAMADRFGTLYVAELLAALRILGGYILLIIPGIRAQLRYQALPYVVMTNPDMTATQAVNETKRLYNGHLIESFGIATVGAIIPFIGTAFASCGYTLSAQQLAAYDKAGKETPSTHPLNYIGIALLALLFFFVGGLIALVIALAD